MYISVVSPVYKAEGIIEVLVSRIVGAVSEITQDFEIILVEDGSPDGSWKKIEAASKSEGRVKGVKLSRNFGQHSAITAGLSLAQGEWMIVMDCDLQDRPEEITALYNKALEGHDVVVGRKKERRHNIIRKIESYCYYYFLEVLTGIKVSDGIGNFGIYNKKAIESYLMLKEEYRSFGMMIIWLGFNRYEMEITSDARYSGESSYTFLKKWKLALTTIVSFSDRILNLVILAGLAISFVSFVFLIFYLLEVWANYKPLSGWTSLILSIFFSLGLMMSCIGIVGLYVGKIFSQVKHRPTFVISKLINHESD